MSKAVLLDHSIPMFLVLSFISHHFFLQFQNIEVSLKNMERKFKLVVMNIFRIYKKTIDKHINYVSREKIGKYMG